MLREAIREGTVVGMGCALIKIRPDGWMGGRLACRPAARLSRTVAASVPPGIRKRPCVHLGARRLTAAQRCRFRLSGIPYASLVWLPGAL